MKAYSYDNNGIFNGIIECVLDPLEKELNNKEIYLSPGNSTLIPVPNLDIMNQRAKWNGEAWLIEDVDKKEVNIEQIKIEKISQSKQLLEELLESHPLEYKGEHYSITQEKQTLLTSAIAAYQLKVQAGIPAILKWNTTGDICREFTLEEITGLVIAITDYVQPRVEKQQALELQIKNCTTIEELDSIIIDYEVV